MLKVVDHTHKASLKVLRGLIPDNIGNKSQDNSHPLGLRNTLRNMGNNSIEDPNATKKPLFNNSVIGSEHESLIKDGRTPDMSPQKEPVQEKDFFVKRGVPAKSAYVNVTIDCKFENILPYLIQLNKTDIIESLIDSFGENKVNHLNLLIMHQQETAAL